VAQPPRRVHPPRSSASAGVLSTLTNQPSHTPFPGNSLGKHVSCRVSRSQGSSSVGPASQKRRLAPSRDRSPPGIENVAAATLTWPERRFLLTWHRHAHAEPRRRPPSFAIGARNPTGWRPSVVVFTGDSSPNDLGVTGVSSDDIRTNEPLCEPPKWPRKKHTQNRTEHAWGGLGHDPDRSTGCQPTAIESGPRESEFSLRRQGSPPESHPRVLRRDEMARSRRGK